MNLFTFIKKLPLFATLLCAMTIFAPCTAENTLTKTFAKADSIDVSRAKHRHCHHKRSEIFKPFGESVTVNIVMTIPQLIGPVDPGQTLDITPFAIGPNGKIYKGGVTNIIPVSLLVQPLDPVIIPHPVQGNYVIGYYVTLGEGSTIFSPNTLANFSAVLLNNPVGDQLQSITFPVQTLFLGLLESEADVLTITGNFPIVKN